MHAYRCVPIGSKGQTQNRPSYEVLLQNGESEVGWMHTPRHPGNQTVHCLLWMSLYKSWVASPVHGSRHVHQCMVFWLSRITGVGRPQNNMFLSERDRVITCDLRHPRPVRVDDQKPFFQAFCTAKQALRCGVTLKMWHDFCQQPCGKVEEHSRLATLSTYAWAALIPYQHMF